MSKVNKDIFNLFSTVRIDGGEIRKSFVTVVHPPKSFAGFGIPKVILSEKKLSEQEIDQNLEEMARQNARWLFKQAEGNQSNAD
jgi:hypothetical protein